MAGAPLKRQRKSGMSLDDIREILSWHPSRDAEGLLPVASRP
jgi:hypothetical protein